MIIEEEYKCIVENEVQSLQGGLANCNVSGQTDCVDTCKEDSSMVRALDEKSP